jgi:hypothetical protein
VSKAASERSGPFLSGLVRSLQAILTYLSHNLTCLIRSKRPLASRRFSGRMSSWRTVRNRLSCRWQRRGKFSHKGWQNMGEWHLMSFGIVLCIYRMVVGILCLIKAKKDRT